MEEREHCKHRQEHQRQKKEQSLLLEIPSGSIQLNGNLESPENPIGIVLLAYSSGSSRYSPRNRYIARKLRESKIATLLFDLLTYEEEQIDRQTLHLRSDINLLSRRLVDATNWIIDYNNKSAGFSKQTRINGKKYSKNSLNLNIGYFCARTATAAALLACSKLKGNNNSNNSNIVKAIVSRGGRPDLIGKDALLEVRSPTLLVVGIDDEEVVKLNKESLDHLRNTLQRSKLVIVPGSTRHFEEPETLPKLSDLAVNWFVKHFKKKL